MIIFFLVNYKRPLENIDDKGLKRRKNVFPTNQYKAQTPNAIVIPADKMPSVTQTTMSQLDIATAFSSQSNNISKYGQFYSCMQVQVFALDGYIFLGNEKPHQCNITEIITNLELMKNIERKCNMYQQTSDKSIISL